MAWRYKPEYVRDGDVVEPSEWRININESVSELNGFLDSDNVGRDAIDVSKVKRGAFTEVFTNEDSPALCYVFNHTQSGWIRETETTINSDINDTTFDLPDEPAIDGAYRALEDGGSPLTVRKLPQSVFTPNEDGLVIAEFSGCVNWLTTQTHPDLEFIDSKGHGTAYGNYNLSEYGFFAKQSKRFKQLNSLVLCSMWRLTVNGQSVAETGPLGNEYSAHPIYLCGATPILKNKETVVQLEGQFVWYCLGKDEYVSSSSFNPKYQFLQNLTDEYDVPLRKDCSLFAPTMIVTYRKR